MPNQIISISEVISQPMLPFRSLIFFHSLISSSNFNFSAFMNDEKIISFRIRRAFDINTGRHDNGRLVRISAGMTFGRKNK